MYIFATLLKTKRVHQTTKRAISSAGSEHLVYTQRVGGSNPSSPTKPFQLTVETAFFIVKDLDS